MKLNIKEIKYIRQSLEYRAKYYKDKPQYKEFLNEINKVLKKFISLEGKEYKNVNSLNKNISEGIGKAVWWYMEHHWKNTLTSGQDGFGLLTGYW